MESGTRLDRYVLEEELGTGGFGAVYRGRHAVVGRPVAIKLLHAERTGDRATVERFLKEARAAASIGSPHIVQVLDAGVMGDRPFIVMELLEGEDLADRLSRRGALTASQAVELGAQILDALEAAHARGIVHRDLKPANVFLANRGDGGDFVKLLDFGVSKFHTDHALGPMTETGMVLGTPQYMAPEQFRASRDVDGRADLFSCAVILYEALSGRLPYEATTLETLIVRMATEPPTPLARVVPGIPTPLAQVIERGLARDPDARWRDAGSMRDALLAAASGSALAHVSDATIASAITPSPAIASTRETPSAAPSITAHDAAATRSAPTPARGGPPVGPRRSNWPSAGDPSRASALPVVTAVPASSASRSGRRWGRALAIAGGGGLALGVITAGTIVLLASGPTPGDPAPSDLPVLRPMEVLGPPPAASLDAALAPDKDAGAMRAEPALAPAPGEIERDVVIAAAEPSGGRTRFDVDILSSDIPGPSAERVVERALSRIDRCRVDGREHRVRVQLLVQMHGRIAIAQPDPTGPHGDTEVARCVARAIKSFGGTVEETEMGGIYWVDVTLPAR